MIDTAAAALEEGRCAMTSAKARLAGRPYWDAGPAYAPFDGGVFGGFSGLVPDLLLGSMLGGGWGDP